MLMLTSVNGTNLTFWRNKMNSYWVMVKYKDEPGAGFSRAYINADNPFQAIAMARSMYGRLLISESANLAY
jgi:hypothetical protein